MQRIDISLLFGASLDAVDQSLDVASAERTTQPTVRCIHTFRPHRTTGAIEVLILVLIGLIAPIKATEGDAIAVFGCFKRARAEIAVRTIKADVSADVVSIAPGQRFGDALQLISAKTRGAIQFPVLLRQSQGSQN